ncbi:MAG TPA: arginine deiminase, partial [Thermoleophilia bacterium]|nr:arginine deiminase [Thermoleophilia bacterium]
MTTLPATQNAPAATAAGAAVGVHSEVGRLHTVLLHRPGLELQRLTPANKDDLLFDDVLWVKRARQEHDAFADALRERGVRVLYLHELLTQTIETSAHARADLVEKTLEAAGLGPSLGREVGAWLSDLPAPTLTAALIGGVTFDELTFASGSLAARLAAPEEFVLTPLPNHLFTRDTSAWIGRGVTVNAMAKPARARESVNLDAVYRHHPLFAGARFERWSDHVADPPNLEGGDILVIGNGCVLVGMGERTRPGAVEQLALRLFAAGASRRVIAVALPKRRSAMHLDTVMTMVDRDAFTVYPELRATMAGFVIQPGEGPGRVQIEPAADLFAAIADALGLPSLRLIETGGDRYEAQREQWDDGNN